MAFRSGTEICRGSSSSPSCFWLKLKLASLHMAFLGRLPSTSLPHTLHFAFLLFLLFTFLSPHHPCCTAHSLLHTQPHWPFPGFHRYLKLKTNLKIPCWGLDMRKNMACFVSGPGLPHHFFQFHLLTNSISFFFTAEYNYIMSIYIFNHPFINWWTAKLISFLNCCE